MPIHHLRRFATFALLLWPTVTSAQGARPPSTLTWRELAPSSLGSEDSIALALVPDLHPTQWPVKRADLTLSAQPLFFLKGKVGSGTGFGYYAGFLFARAPVRLLWSAVTREFVAESEFLPTGWNPFELNGCLFTTPDSIGYAVVAHPHNMTATQALTTDSLVRPAAWYRLNETSSGLVAGSPVSRELTERCADTVKS